MSGVFVKRSNKILFVGIILILLVSLFGVIYINLTKSPEQKYETPLPEKIASQYFESWNSKDWPDMYATLSDGFKKIEPTARNLSVFSSYVNSQGINGINITNIKEKSNDGNTAIIDYSVEFTLNDTNRKKYTGIFTLKYRPGDVIVGWKLIHPYGSNIDNS